MAPAHPPPTRGSRVGRVSRVRSRYSAFGSRCSKQEAGIRHLNATVTRRSPRTIGRVRQYMEINYRIVQAGAGPLNSKFGMAGVRCGRRIAAWMATVWECEVNKAGWDWRAARIQWTHQRTRMDERTMGRRRACRYYNKQPPPPCEEAFGAQNFGRPSPFAAKSHPSILAQLPAITYSRLVGTGRR